MLGNFGEVWQRTGLVQRVLLVGVLLACVGAVTLLVGWARKPHMELLWSKLPPEDAATIVEKIRDQGISYELKDGGRSVYVPSEKVYSLRLTMAEQGLPIGQNEGWEILDKEKIGSSPLSQRMNHIRAIAGELAKSIETLDDVAAARVLVAKPEQAFFGPQKKASASVVLRLRGGRRLASRSVAAIVHLVAGGVEGLQPEDVTVVDSSGNLLSGDGSDSMAGGASTALDYQSQVELYLARKAEEMLTSVLGPGRASIQVSVEVDMNMLDTTTEAYDSEKGAIKEMTEKSMKSTTPPVGDAETGAETSDTTETTEYFPPAKNTTRQVKPPGKVLSRTVAVLVDLSPPQKEGEDEGAEAAKPTITVEEVKEIVVKATGAKEDEVVVKEASFYRPTDDGIVEAGSSDFILEIARRSSLGILVIGALLALKIFGGGKKQAVPADGSPALEAQITSTDKLLSAPPGASPGALKQRITAALQDNPEEVKRLFMNWVDSGKGER